MQRLLILALCSVLASGCTRACGTLEIGGQSGFSVFIGDLDREVPIENTYRDSCNALTMTPSTGYASPYGGIDLVVWLDHKNRQIDATMATYLWAAMRATGGIREGAVLSLEEGTLAPVLKWDAFAPHIDDYWMIDGVPTSDVNLQWPVDVAEIEIDNMSGPGCDGSGDIFVKGTYRMEGGPIGDDVEPWFTMEGTDTFRVPDAALICD